MLKRDKKSSMRTIAVIPARGGSKGIPRKNMRLMNGKPLIAYSIENALASAFIDTVVVSSDSEEIREFAQQYEGVIALDRDSALAEDAVTLDPVIYDAVLRIEQDQNVSFDIVVTLQPTSPLLTAETLDEALGLFSSGEWDSMISVVNAPHLSWILDGEENPIPDYGERLNRQMLPPHYLETGAFLISKRAVVCEKSRLGERVTVFEVPEDQSVDIDTKQDWIVCEALLAKKTIAFRADGYRELGLGHIYRVLTLAYDLIEHDIVFICDAHHPLGIEKLKSANMKVVEVANDDELLSWLDENQIDIFVNDLLDTTPSYVCAIKERVGRFISFEDMGEGARLADAVVNALYEGASPHHNTYQGKEYVCLRDEFQAATPSRFNEGVLRVLVSFGGTDPLDLTERVYRIAQQLNEEGVQVKFDFVLGPGYSNDSIVAIEQKGIYVSRDVARVSDHMRKADLALSSQGRTTYELAAMGVPAIVLAQNEREQLHTFAQMDNGFINLGLGSEVLDEDIKTTITWLMAATSVRHEMRNRMLANDLKSGIGRVRRIILGDMLGAK